MQMTVTQHPLTEWERTPSNGSRLVLLCDDTEDPPLDRNNAQNKETYDQWHTLCVPYEILTNVEKEWMRIKGNHKITYLHCSKIRPDSSFQREIQGLLKRYPIKHYFSSWSRSDWQHFVKKEVENWYFKQPRELSLWVHLKILDKRLSWDFNKPESIAFCDRTSGSKIMFENGQSINGVVWGHWTHGYLENIHNEISFRIHEHNDPKDSAGRCLDLVDYCAWVTQRVLKKMNLREFVDKDLSSQEWENRLNRLNISDSDKELAEYFRECINSKKCDIMDFDPLIKQ